MSRELHGCLSIDLALAAYRDIGAAIVRADADGRLFASVLDVPGSGRPTVPALVAFIASVSTAEGLGCIAIDGPLGWRSPETDSPHARLSERALRAPGKTGLPPDGVKPRNYLPFTQLSIALFEALTADGWLLPDAPGTPGDPLQHRVGMRRVTECFPTAAWRGLGLTPLAGKARCRPDDVRAACARLTEALPLTIAPHAAPLTHDQLQAIVGGIAPAWWMAGHTGALHFAGAPPVRLEGSWREGYILAPSRPGR